MASKTKKSKKAKKAKSKKKAPAKAVKKSKAVKKKPVKKKAATKKKAAKAVKKSPPRAVKKIKKKKKQIVGEGDYAASRLFLKDQAGFVKRNKAKIPALGKQAERALEGPEGKDLLAAEAEAKSHSKAGSEQ